MISDQQTNLLYLADSLPKNYPIFYRRFEELLKNCGVKTAFLPHTKDVWAVDFMPIQININKFVQFIYNPPYLQSKKNLKTISDVSTICKLIEIEPIKAKIILDGGNVIRTTDKVILTDRIFSDNPTYDKKKLVKELHDYFEVDKLFLIPEQPKDFTGHSDGMVRFIDNQTIFINDYQDENKKEVKQFIKAFEIAIHNTGLDYIKLPYNPYLNNNDVQANGYYINYLQMENIIIIPIFGFKEDEIAVKQFENIFNNHSIVTINSNEIANDGGVLNCISWNILKP